MKIGQRYAFAVVSPRSPSLSVLVSFLTSLAPSSSFYSKFGDRSSPPSSPPQFLTTRPPSRTSAPPTRSRFVSFLFPSSTLATRSDLLCLSVANQHFICNGDNTLSVSSLRLRASKLHDFSLTVFLFCRLQLHRVRFLGVPRTQASLWSRRDLHRSSLRISRRR